MTSVANVDYRGAAAPKKDNYWKTSERLKY